MIHHVELWTDDLAAAEPGWHWLLTRLGCELVDNPDWPDGRSWEHPSGPYICLEQSPAVTGAHDRMRAGLNHLALVVPANVTLDELRAEAGAHGWSELFADRYPNAGGPDHHALYLENTQGFEVELVTAVLPQVPEAPVGASLRPVRTDDAARVLEAFLAHPDMGRQGEVRDLPSAQRYVDWLLADDREAVAVVDDDDVLHGLVAITIDDENRSGWFFYWMHPNARGRGWTSWAARCTADRALTPTAEGGLGLERLELGHRSNNPASGAVARAAGFHVEGVEHGKFLVDGERVDVLACARLR